MLIVPENLNRNAKNVRKLGDPADTGKMLLDYMCDRIGLADLSGCDLLDVGCGVRFSQALINRNMPIGSYTGLEVAKPVIDFLKENVDDPRFSYHHVNVSNRMYNPKGEVPDADTPSPLGDAKFDVASMFSVITHQNPEEAAWTFGFLFRHVRRNGHLFFSAFLHDDAEDYRELNPENPGLRSSYSLPYLAGLLAARGWHVVSVAEPRPNGLPIMSSLLCTKNPDHTIS